MGREERASLVIYYKGASGESEFRNILERGSGEREESESRNILERGEWGERRERVS